MSEYSHVAKGHFYSSILTELHWGKEWTDNLLIDLKQWINLKPEHKLRLFHKFLSRSASHVNVLALRRWICFCIRCNFGFLLSSQREAQEREEAEQVRLERMRKEQEEEKEVRIATAGMFVPMALYFLFCPDLLQMCRSVRLAMFILHYTRERSQLQWDHPHKCHLTYTVIVLLNSDLAHSLVLKPNYIKAWGHSCTQPHTDNLSQHTYSPENNYWRRIEANRHTQRQRHCHACRENNNCVWRWHPCCNTNHSNSLGPLLVVYSWAERLMLPSGIGWPSSFRWFVTWVRQTATKDSQSEPS